MRQFKGKSMKKGAFLDYINQADLTKYAQKLRELRGEEPRPTYGLFCDDLDAMQETL